MKNINHILNFLIVLLFNMVIRIVFVTKIAVNIEQIMPTESVIEKPFTGPDPNMNRIIEAIKVVIFASNIVTIDLLNPESKA